MLEAFARTDGCQTLWGSGIHSVFILTEFSSLIGYLFVLSSLSTRSGPQP